MTEERFEQVIENAIEGAANKFDHSMNRAWKHKPVRVIGKSIACLSGVCLISGGIVIAANIIELLIFRKR